MIQPTHLDLIMLRTQGFVIARNLIPESLCLSLQHTAQTHLDARIEPLEYEADLRYPGAPASRHAEGGHTIRRLLDAYGRGNPFQAAIQMPQIVYWIQQYFKTPIVFVRSHHNCIMSKHPIYASITGWHQDKRYWSFTDDDLVSAWIPLDKETADNGGLSLIPGSNTMAFPAHCFDHNQFFQADPIAHPMQAALLKTAITPELNRGDVLFFHCKTLHSSGLNLSKNIKFSVIFTYHSIHTNPIPHTRSTAQPEVPLDFLSDLVQ